MKLTITLILFAVLAATAGSSYSQTTRINLKVKDATLVDVFREIERTSEFGFFFKSEEIDLNKHVTVELNNASIEDILKNILEDEYSYRILNKNIVVTRTNFNPMEQQQKTVSGKVSDSSGGGLPGVSVVVKGTTTGVITDMDGNYTLPKVPENATLQFSFVGMKSQEIAVGNQTTINVVLVDETIGIEEVVAIGYGSMNKKDLRGSVSSVRGESLEKAVFTTIDQTIQGRASGVMATTNSGEPGGNVTIRIRGNNSINGNNDPLYVVDGMPISAVGEASGASFSNSGSPISSINPQDIESIDVLKDASSTAIYGSRGSNGVVLITTKRGKQGKASIELFTDYTSSQIIDNYEVLNGRDYALYRNEANVALGKPQPFANPEDYIGKGINWVDEITKKGMRKVYGLSVSGGQNNFNYFISGNYLNDKGTVLGSDFERGSLRTNMDFKALNDKLNIRFNLNASQTHNNRAISQSTGFPDAAGVIVNALMSDPLVPSREFSGMTEENNQFYNPYLDARDKTDITRNIDAFSNLEASYKFLNDFTLTANGGFNHRLSDRDVFFPKTVAAGILQNGVANTNELKSFNYSVTSYLNYQNKFNNHFVDATLGYEFNEFEDLVQSTSVSNFELDNLGIDALQIGTSRNSNSSGHTLSILKSGFFRFNYNFKDRYLLTFTGRADGSSKFAVNNKWAFFPSVAGAWKVSNEEFIRNSSVISNLKLRLSYGESGNQAIAPYQSLASYNTIVYPTGNVSTLGYIPTSVANPNLRWETTNQLDIGLDVGILNNRLSLTVDYFDKLTNDLIQTISLPSQSGYSSSVINFGSNQNRGVELNLNAYPISTPKLKWNSSLIFTSYKTKIIELGGSKEIFGPGLGANLTGSGHIFRPGHEYALFYGLKVIGLIQKEDFTSGGNINIPIYSNDSQLGHWKYEDINKDGIINADDRTIIGNPNPKFILGWNNDFTYKNFSLNIFMQGVVGNDIYNVIGTVLNSGFKNDEHYKNQTTEWWDKRWTNDNTHNDIRYPSLNSLAPPVSSRMVEDGSYLRLKSLSLRYDVPLKSSVLQNLQVYITSTNLLTLTKYSGMDPEVSQFGSNNLAPGVDLGSYPQNKSFTLGLKLKL